LRLCWSLLVRVGGPYDCSMCSESKEESYDIGEEEHDCSEPAVRSDSVYEEVVIDCRNLAKVTPSTVSIWLPIRVIDSATSIADKFML
jgi:hypothetical protein